MYAADHLPPHFHVRLHDGREVLVEIATLDVLRGSVARRELADPATFRSARVGEWGASVQWAGRDDLELAADNLRARHRAGGRHLA